MLNALAGTLGGTRRLCDATEGTVDISCPVTGDMSSKPITVGARCCPICMVFSFPLRHPSDPVSRRKPKKLRHDKCRVACLKRMGRKETGDSATIGLTRFIF